MTAIVSDDKYKCIFSDENDRIQIEICSQKSNSQ